MLVVLGVNNERGRHRPGAAPVCLFTCFWLASFSHCFLQLFSNYVSVILHSMAARGGQADGGCGAAVRPHRRTMRQQQLKAGSPRPFSAIAVISWIVLGYSDSAAEGRGTKRALVATGPTSWRWPADMNVAEAAAVVGGDSRRRLVGQGSQEQRVLSSLAVQGPPGSPDAMFRVRSPRSAMP